MPMPKNMPIKNGKLPDQPGVYFYYDEQGKLLYVGKATSLKRRVSSYFTKTHQDAKTQDLVAHIRRIEYEITESALEALVLEANMIRKFLPPYNIKGKDDKSFLYLCITREDFPRPLLYRGGELEGLGYRLNKLGAPLRRKDKKFLAIFGPYTSGPALQAALKIIRKSVPFATHEPAQPGKPLRACFYYHLGQCPGTCVNAITPPEYKKHITNLIRIFSGKKADIIKDLKKQMLAASKEMNFEKAAELRNRIKALTHIRDISVITAADKSTEAPPAGVNVFGRVEAYDISNISGTSAVGSMTVFRHGQKSPVDYRMFKIKTVQGANDFAMMQEVLERRFSLKNRAAWGLPDVVVIDGGLGQVNAAKKVLMSYGLDIPMVGLAKGFDRKQDVLVFAKNDPELKRAAEQNKEILQKVRDEAHRFAVKYHRKLRGINSLK